MIYSKKTIIFGLYIILSAAFMRQLHDLLVQQAGTAFIAVLLWSVLSGMALLGTIAVLRERSSVKFFLSSVIIAGFVYFAFTLQVQAERVHLIHFGLLGWLMCRDTAGRRGYSCIAYSIIGCAIVASLEELFQFFLPGRVGEIRDVGLALVGAVGGVALYIIHLVQIRIGVEDRSGEVILKHHRDR